MDNVSNKTPLFIALLRRFSGVFSITIITMTLAGILTGPDADTSSLFMPDGLSYGTILQLTVFALIIAVCSLFMFSDDPSGKIRFWWRLLIFMLLTMLTASLFVLLFKWFPADDIHAWIGFIVSTLFCFSASTGLTLLKLKLEGKKYDKLLARYKERHR